MGWTNGLMESQKIFFFFYETLQLSPHQKTTEISFKWLHTALCLFSYLLPIYSPFLFFNPLIKVPSFFSCLGEWCNIAVMLQKGLVN